MHILNDLVGRTLILVGLFVLAVLVTTAGRRHRRHSWQRVACQLSVGLLSAAALAVIAVR